MFGFELRGVFFHCSHNYRLGESHKLLGSERKSWKFGPPNLSVTSQKEKYTNNSVTVAYRIVRDNIV
jgi:hypothetical protein